MSSKSLEREPPTTLDDIFFKRKAEPYTTRALFAYLETQMAIELLDFWLAAQDVRNMFEPEHPRSTFKGRSFVGLAI
jgi:hypothetical protein